MNEKLGVFSMVFRPSSEMVGRWAGLAALGHFSLIRGPQHEQHCHAAVLDNSVVSTPGRGAADQVPRPQSNRLGLRGRAVTPSTKHKRVHPTPTQNMS